MSSTFTGRPSGVDQEPPGSRFDQRVDSEQLRLLVQQLGYVKTIAVLASLPGHVSNVKDHLCGVTHALLNDLLELGFDLSLGFQCLANRLQVGQHCSHFEVTGEI